MGQSVELYQHLEGSLDLSKEVLEIAEVHVCSTDLVLVAERGGPNLMQLHIHPHQTAFDRCVVTLKHLLDSKV